MKHKLLGNRRLYVCEYISAALYKSIVHVYIKKRLFEYLHPEQKMRPYEPFKGTEIGKSLPILNF